MAGNHKFMKQVPLEFWKDSIKDFQNSLIYQKSYWLIISSMRLEKSQVDSDKQQLPEVSLIILSQNFKNFGAINIFKRNWDSKFVFFIY